jgi:hypothetical protein
MLSVNLLSVANKPFMLSVNYAQCCKQALYAECHCTDGRYAECRGAANIRLGWNFEPTARTACDRVIIYITIKSLFLPGRHQQD